MNHKLVLLIICLFIASGSALGQNLEQPQIGKGQTIKVGVILPMTGRAQTIGNSIWSGIQLQMKNLAPSEKDQIELILEDDTSQTTQALSAFRKLQSEGIKILLSAMSGTGNALAPLAEQAQLPMISFAYDSKISRNRKYVTNMWTGVEDAAAKAVEECKNRKYKKIAIVNTQHEGNIAMREAFIKTASDSFEIIEADEILPTETDFHSSIVKLKNISNIDAIANFLFPTQSGVFARQAKELGLNVSEFSLGTFEDRGVIKSSEGALYGQWYVGTEYSDGFLEMFHKDYPETSEFGAGNGYDVISIIRGLLGKELSPENVMSEIRALIPRSGAAKEFWYDGSGVFRFRLAIKLVK